MPGGEPGWDFAVDAAELAGRGSGRDGGVESTGVDCIAPIVGSGHLHTGTRRERPYSEAGHTTAHYHMSRTDRDRLPRRGRSHTLRLAAL